MITATRDGCLRAHPDSFLSLKSPPTGQRIKNPLQCRYSLIVILGQLSVCSLCREPPTPCRSHRPLAIAVHACS